MEENKKQEIELLVNKASMSLIDLENYVFNAKRSKYSMIKEYSGRIKNTVENISELSTVAIEDPEFIDGAIHSLNIIIENISKIDTAYKSGNEVTINEEGMIDIIEKENHAIEVPSTSSRLSEIANAIANMPVSKGEDFVEPPIVGVETPVYTEAPIYTEEAPVYTETTPVVEEYQVEMPVITEESTENYEDSLDTEAIANFLTPAPVDATASLRLG